MLQPIGEVNRLESPSKCDLRSLSNLLQGVLAGRCSLIECMEAFSAPCPDCGHLFHDATPITAFNHVATCKAQQELRAAAEERERKAEEQKVKAAARRQRALASALLRRRSDDNSGAMKN